MRAVMVALAGFVLAAACAGGDNSEAVPSATVPVAPATTTTTNPYAIPQVIDAAYVNRVLAGLDAAISEIVRIVVRTRDIPPEVIDRLRAVYQERSDINLELQGFGDDLRASFAGYREVPGNQRTILLDLISASPECVFARIRHDFAEMRANSTSLEPPEWIGLMRAPTDENTTRYNPTPWRIALVGVDPDGSAPNNLCEGR